MIAEGLDDTTLEARAPSHSEMLRWLATLNMHGRAWHHPPSAAATTLATVVGLKRWGGAATAAAAATAATAATAAALPLLPSPRLQPPRTAPAALPAPSPPSAPYARAVAAAARKASLHPKPSLHPHHHKPVAKPGPRHSTVAIDISGVGSHPPPRPPPDSQPPPPSAPPPPHQEAVVPHQEAMVRKRTLAAMPAGLPPSGLPPGAAAHGAARQAGAAVPKGGQGKGGRRYSAVHEVVAMAAPPRPSPAVELIAGWLFLKKEHSLMGGSKRRYCRLVGTFTLTAAAVVAAAADAPAATGPDGGGYSQVRLLMMRYPDEKLESGRVLDLKEVTAVRTAPKVAARIEVQTGGKHIILLTPEHKPDAARWLELLAAHSPLTAAQG